MKRYWMKGALRFLVFAGLALAVLGVVVMSLWNWLMPGLFGSRLITFWQALGLLALTRVLVGRFGGGPGRWMHWRSRMRERWNRMTPEEREKFAQRMRRYWQRSGPKGAAPGA